MNNQVRLLQGGYLNKAGVVKQGRSVIRRQDHLWPQAVGEALNALAGKGYKHCPKEINRLDSCSVVLTYMPGKALSSPVPRWAASQKTLVRVVSFFRHFSLAAQGLGNDLTRSDWLIPPMSDGNVLVHGDPHPTNIVFNIRRQPTAIVDFELATLGTHDWNLISLLFSWAPLEPLELTCWKEMSSLPVTERILTILDHWPPESSVEQFIETGHTFVKWRRTWIAELAGLGNPGATNFMNDPNFEKRYQHALDLLEQWLP
jgi:phosphotransferase family enzyme